MFSRCVADKLGYGALTTVVLKYSYVCIYIYISADPSHLQGERVREKVVLRRLVVVVGVLVLVLAVVVVVVVLVVVVVVVAVVVLVLVLVLALVVVAPLLFLVAVVCCSWPCSCCC